MYDILFFVAVAFVLFSFQNRRNGLLLLSVQSTVCCCVFLLFVAVVLLTSVRPMAFHLMITSTCM